MHAPQAIYHHIMPGIQPTPSLPQRTLPPTFAYRYQFLLSTITTTNNHSLCLKLSSKPFLPGHASGNITTSYYNASRHAIFHTHLPWSPPLPLPSTLPPLPSSSSLLTCPPSPISSLSLPLSPILPASFPLPCPLSPLSPLSSLSL